MKTNQNTFIKTGFTAILMLSTYSGFCQNGGTVPSRVSADIPVSNTTTSLETLKAAETPRSFYKAASTDNELRIAFIYDASDYDECIIKNIPEAKLGFDKYDSYKLTNPDVNISSYTCDSVYLTLNSRPFATQTADTINLNVTGRFTSGYRMEFTVGDLVAPGKSMILLDAFLGTATDLRVQPMYQFIIDKSDAASQGKARFKIVFSAGKTIAGTQTIHSTGTPPIKFSVYPNPVSEVMTISNHSNLNEKVSCEVVDMSGRVLKTFDMQAGFGNETQADLSLLTSGIYFIRFSRNNQQPSVLKFIKI